MLCISTAGCSLEMGEGWGSRGCHDLPDPPPYTAPPLPMGKRPEVCCVALEVPLTPHCPAPAPDCRLQTLQFIPCLPKLPAECLGAGKKGEGRTSKLQDRHSAFNQVALSPGSTHTSRHGEHFAVLSVGMCFGEERSVAVYYSVVFHYAYYISYLTYCILLTML